MKPTELDNEYKEIHPLAERFSQELTRQLEELLVEKRVTLGFPLQRRVKTWDSISGKIKHKSLEIKNIRELQDLIGLRVTLLFQRDAQTVCELIRENCIVLEEENTLERLGDSQFGYSSIHFLIEPKSDWMSLPSFRRTGSFRAEIQVRTVAQHIWAAATHLLQYKHEASVPLPIRRAISRVAALLEMVDLEFERVLKERTIYVEQAKIETTSEELNVDLIARILDEELPPENKDVDDGEDYSDLLSDLIHFDIRTPQKLRTLITTNQNAMMAEESTQMDSCTRLLDSGVVPPGTTIERVNNGVYFTHVGLVRSALINAFDKQWSEYSTNKLAQLSTGSSTGNQRILKSGSPG